MRYFFVLMVALFIISTSGTSNAQISLNHNFNIDTQPAWGPTGYDYVENYYMPDLDIYYNVPQHRYYYYNRGRWVSNSYLPYRYHGYDLYNSYKVVINEREPWQNNTKYRNEYSKYRGQHDQVAIRDSKDPKYFQNKYHPEHKNWVKEQKQNNGNNKSYQKGNNGRKSNDNKGVKRDNNGKNRDNKNNDKKDKKHNG